jgi:UDP-glucose:(heptosyl)LPS alpha-1,3-glucosyltransferase
LHTTGAIVLNRADISTVHYCHRAAARRVLGSRASRPSVAYRLNAIAAGAISRLAESWCYRPRRTRVLCAVSKGVAAELEQEFPSMLSAVRTIPNGVDRERFHPDPAARSSVRRQLGIDDDAHVALFVGGDWHRKGLRYAVDALPAAQDWQLLVAGLGDPAPLLADARAAGTESRLRFLGHVLDTPPLYAASDAFVLPTAYEAFPLVALEAAAAGLPLLVPRVSGVEDLLEDGRNGWFIVRDPADIARRLTQLGSCADTAATMRANAQCATMRFSWQAMGESYLALYRELSGSAPSCSTDLSASRYFRPQRRSGSR